MSLRAWTVAWLASLGVSLLGCSQEAPISMRGNGSGSSTAGRPSSGTTAGTGGSGAASSGSAPTGPSSSGNPETPIVMVQPENNGGKGGGEAAAGSGGGSAEECEEGKFCPNTDVDPDNCGKLELKTDVETVLKPGNVIVVFDRSGSMEGQWNGTPKYEAAGNALIAAITPLKDQLTVGGIFFPSAPNGMDGMCPNGCNVADPTHWIPGPQACCLNGVAGSCEVNTIDKPDEIAFTPADMFISAMPTQWHLAGANGTPLEAGIMRAAEAIQGRMTSDRMIVIVMTDGEPNCGTNAQNVVNQIMTWQSQNITTYVVGLPGAQDAAALLDMMAAAGGTGNYIDPMNPQDLEMRLRSAISSTVRAGFKECTFHLDPKAEVPDKLHLIVTQNGADSDIPRDWSKDAHWKINAEGTQVDLEGQLCDMAKDGTLEGVRFVFGCVDVPPAEPPPPPS